MLIAIPTAATIGLPQGAMKLLLGVCLLAAVLPNGTRRTRYVLIAAIVLLILVRFASEGGYFPLASGLVLGLYGLIGLLAAAGTLRFAVSADQVDSEIVYAALSTYLLAGLFFGQIYWSIEQAWPGSLTGPDPVSELHGGLLQLRHARDARLRRLFAAQRSRSRYRDVRSDRRPAVPRGHGRAAHRRIRHDEESRPLLGGLKSSDFRRQIRALGAWRRCRPPTR